MKGTRTQAACLADAAPPLFDSNSPAFKLGMAQQAIKQALDLINLGLPAAAIATLIDIDERIS